MRKLQFWLLPLAVLGACETSSSGERAYTPLVHSYYACLYRAADRYARTSSENAYYLALAAKDACATERMAAQEEVYAATRPASRLRVWQILDGVETDIAARITRKRAG